MLDIFGREHWALPLSQQTAVLQHCCNLHSSPELRGSSEASKETILYSFLDQQTDPGLWLDQKDEEGLTPLL